MISATAFLGGVAGIAADHLWWMWLAVGVLSSVVAGLFFNFAEMTDDRNGSTFHVYPNQPAEAGTDGTARGQLQTRGRAEGQRRLAGPAAGPGARGGHPGRAAA